MQRQCVEAAIERVGNAACLIQLRCTRLLGRAGIEGGGEGVLRLLAAKHDSPPSTVDPNRTPRHVAVPLCTEPNTPSMRRTVPLILAAIVAAAPLLAGC